MVLAVLVAAVCGAVVVACVQRARQHGWKAPGLGSFARSRALPPTPPEDRPPAGLAPLIPSPRVLASEFERGLRELTLFLAVQKPE